MPTKAELNEQLQHAIDCARTISANAKAAGRELTAAERADAQKHLDHIETLRYQRNRAGGDEAVMAAIEKLSHGTYGGPSVPPRVKAAGGTGGWSQKVLGTANGGGVAAKELLPNGAVPVTVPLNPEPVRQDEPVLTLRQLIGTTPDTTGRWSFMKQTLRDNQAAVVAPGARKPVSLFSLAREEARSVTLAHLSEPLHRQDLDDAPMLEQFIDTELRLGLELALEDEIVNGTGEGEHFAGLANTSGVQLQDYDTDPLRTTRRAVTALEVLGLSATGWVLSPRDWENIELAGDAGAYTLAAAGQAVPVERAARRLWGIPVAISTTLTPGTGYLVDFTGSTELRIREDARIDWSEGGYDPNRFGDGDGGTLFEANQVQFRCEMRAGFVVTRPAGVVQVSTAPSVDDSPNAA